MKKAFVDTSSIIFGLSKNRNVFELLYSGFPEYVPVISKGILEEIRRMASGRSRHSKYGKAALALIKQDKRIKVSSSREYPDKWIITNSSAGDIACSNDAELRKELRKKGIRAVSVSVGGVLR